MNSYHTTVLLQEAIDGLRVTPGQKYIDATLGGGGHTGEIISHGGIALGIDTDSDALQFVRENFKFQISNSKLKLARGNFKDIDTIAKENGFEEVSGIIFDFGVSNHQLEEGMRGFSFRKDAMLDMRMDHSLTVTAADLINVLTKEELYELITKFGEDHFARRISEAIVRARKVKPVTTTAQLSQIVKRVVPWGIGKIHPATKLFQALRIAVNDELNNIKISLPKSIALLKNKGRIACISFHSLEDRLVKQSFLEWERIGLGVVITKKPVVPTEEEITLNPKSRSAKLRIFEKL